MPGYHRSLFNKLLDKKAQEESSEQPVVVFIVCGGFKINLGMVAEYQAVKETGGTWAVKDDDGHKFSFEK